MTTFHLLSICAAGLLGSGSVTLIFNRKKPANTALLLFFLSTVLFSLLCIFNRHFWQLVPGCSTSIVLFLVIVFGRRTKRTALQAHSKTIFVRAGGMVLGLSAAAATILFISLMPPFKLPAPTGMYQVGVIDYDFTDSLRNELFGPVPGGPRELMVRIWYPAQPEKGSEKNPYVLKSFAEEYSKIFAEALGAPPLKVPMLPFIFNHFAAVSSHSFYNAPMCSNAGKLPVLLFSHGIGIGTVGQNTTTCEDLASHGYIVVSITHPYECGLTAFTDGQTIPMDIKRFSLLYRQVFAVTTSTDSLKHSTNEDVRDRAFATIIRKMSLWKESVDVWTADTRFVIDKIIAMQQGVSQSPITGYCDTSRIGVFGHSFGGATSGRVCLLDDRVKAGINYDCHQFGFERTDTLSKPFMYLYAEDNKYVNDPVVRRATGPITSLVIKGTRHFNFNDLSLCGPLFRILTFTGTINGNRCLAVLNNLTRSFFDSQFYNKENRVPFETIARQYPEVEWRDVPR